MQILETGKISYRKSRKHLQTGFQDQFEILQVINSEIHKRFKRDPKINPQEANPLSEDVTNKDNILLIKKVADGENFQTANQINSMNTPGPDGIYTIFYPKWCT